jgi:UDP-N-acetylmuramate: L-alanyl-gamma-D-glutamyl-meso-diaminopimelate ligase
MHFPNADELLEALIKAAAPKDVILIMSNGPFNNIHQKLLNGLNGG